MINTVVWRRAASALAMVIAAVAASAVTPAGTPRLTVLHDLAGGEEGNGRGVGLAVAPSGDLYGTSPSGGTPFACTLGGCGNVFRLRKPANPGAGWSFELLHAFAPDAGGSLPVGNIPAIGPDGTLYGTTFTQGPLNAGVVWSLSPPAVATGAWAYAVLHAFDPAHGALGTRPRSGVVRNSAGVLYGLADGRPDAAGSPTGVVFALAPPAPGSTVWTETVLHTIAAAPIPGGKVSLSAGVTLSHDEADLLGAYGVLAPDAAASRAYVFELHRGPGGWTASTLHEFPSFGDFSPLIADARRQVFATFFEGGIAASQSGVIFGLSPPAPGQGAPEQGAPEQDAWSEQDLLTYDYTAQVYGNLARGAHGELFGTMALNFGSPPDAIFRLDPPAGGAAGQWRYSVLRTFDGFGRKAPVVPLGLARDQGGNLVGTAVYGGTHDKGAVFRQEIYDHTPP